MCASAVPKEYLVDQLVVCGITPIPQSIQPEGCLSRVKINHQSYCKHRGSQPTIAQEALQTSLADFDYDNLNKNPRAVRKGYLELQPYSKQMLGRLSEAVTTAQEQPAMVKKFDCVDAGFEKIVNLFEMMFEKILKDPARMIIMPVKKRQRRS